MGLTRYALQVLAVAVVLIAAPWLVPAARAHNAMPGHGHVGHVHVGHVHVASSHVASSYVASSHIAADHVAPIHVAAAQSADEAGAPAAAGQAVHELRVASGESPADPIDTGGCAVGCCGPGVSCCGAALAILAPAGGMPPPLRALMLGFAQPATGAGVDPEALRKPPRISV